MSATETKIEETTKRSHPIRALIILISGALALLVAIVFSITIGAADIDMTTVWQAVFFTIAI